MNHTVTATIDKLRVWCGGSWKAYDYNMNNTNLTNMCLRLHYDQLLIISENKILESLNLNGKFKGIYKNDVLILITCNALQQMRKIKFLIKTNINECLNKLSLHFPVVSFNNITHSQHQAKYRNVEEVFKTAINYKGADVLKSGLQLPPNYKDFVKICILDPFFPNIIEETQDILKQLDK